MGIIDFVTSDEAIDRYKRATTRYVYAEADVRAASDARARAVLELCESGLTMRAVARMLGMTAARVHKLCERARVLEAVPAVSQGNSSVELSSTGDASLF